MLTCSVAVAQLNNHTVNKLTNLNVAHQYYLKFAIFSHHKAVVILAS